MQAPPRVRYTHRHDGQMATFVLEIFDDRAVLSEGDELATIALDSTWAAVVAETFDATALAGLGSVVGIGTGRGDLVLAEKRLLTLRFDAVDRRPGHFVMSHVAPSIPIH